MKYPIAQLNGVSITGGRLDVNATISGSVPAPSGLSTEAKQDDQITLASTLNGLITALGILVNSIDGNITTCNTGAIVGEVIANAGTNLNTSLLAKEAGGNLATLAGKDFATQTTLALIKAKTDNIPTDPSKESGKLTTIDTTLTSIKSTDGIKKITDPLPAGTNNIGKVQLTDGTNDVTARDLTGAKALDVAIVNSTGTQITTFGSAPINENPKYYTAILTAVNTTDTIDCNTDLGRNAKDWIVINDGAGDITVELSKNGSDYGDAITLKATDAGLSLFMEVDTIKVNYVSANATYRIVIL